jgi:hypothetical protein
MKKCCFAAVCAVLVAAVLGAQEGADTSAASDNILLNTKSYAEQFGFQNGVVKPTSKYVGSALSVERRNFSNLEGHELQVDAPLEFALLSYYSVMV